MVSGQLYRQTGSQSLSVIFSEQGHKVFIRKEYVVNRSKGLVVLAHPTVKVGSAYLTDFSTVQKSWVSQSAEHLTVVSSGGRVLQLSLENYGPIHFHHKNVMAWDFDPLLFRKVPASPEFISTGPAKGQLVLQVAGGNIVQKYLEDEECNTFRQNNIVAYSESITFGDRTHDHAGRWLRLKGPGFIFLCTKHSRKDSPITLVGVCMALVIILIVTLATLLSVDL